MSNNKKLNETITNFSNSNEEYKKEVKQEFFINLFTSFTRKSLPSGTSSGMRKSNISVSSMIKICSFRSKLIKIFENLRNFFVSSKKSEPIKTLPAQIIGNNTIDNNSKTAQQEFNKKIIIPKEISCVVLLAKTEASLIKLKNTNNATNKLFH